MACVVRKRPLQRRRRQWALAMWFSQPNHWLRNRRPVDVLDVSLTAVLRAARADRFIANG